MRIWHPIPPICLDDKRLLGEHRELHALFSILSNYEHAKGYKYHPETLRWNGKLYELYLRHDILVMEMNSRGWNHQSPITYNEIKMFPTFPNTWESIETMRTKLAKKQNHAI